MIPPLVIHADLGVAWHDRGSDHLYIEPTEIPAVVAALQALGDAFDDAADVA